MGSGVERGPSWVRARGPSGSGRGSGGGVRGQTPYVEVVSCTEYVSACEAEPKK